MMEQIIINKDRLLHEFIELVSIDAESFHEREIADVLKRKLSELGIEAYEDNAGEIYGTDTGNLYAYIKGEEGAETILLSAHMDTVSPGLGKKALVHDHLITSDGTTVLGADDVAGIVEILEGIRSLKEAGIPHKNIELLFPIAEEPYTKGATVFDYSKLKSKRAYCLDMSGSIGSAAIKAPSLISFVVTVKGKASHAGFAPEQGINAIAIAADAISKIKQGQIDEDTTLNIGKISGGIQTNIISELCICEGEVRSFNHEKALEALEEVKKAFEATAKTYGGQSIFDHTIHLVAYEVSKDDYVVTDFCKACEQLGITPNVVSTLGGADNHQFNLNGIPGLVLSCGMERVHSTEEYIKIKDLEDGAKLVNLLLRANQDFDDLTFRTAKSSDVEALTVLEALCFPPSEAATKKQFSERVADYGKHFLLLEDDGKLICAINGLVTDEEDLVDEMFADTSYHKEDGKWQMIFGVETHPDYQKKGLATLALRKYIELAKEGGRAGLVLTCKEKLLPFYANVGFVNEGISVSEHGGETWYQMRLTF